MTRRGSVPVTVDWNHLHAVRQRIAELETELARSHEERRALIEQMVAAGMKGREIGSYWRLSQPRIAQIMKADRAVQLSRP